MNAYGRLQEEFINKDGYIIEEKVQKIINGFNISPELFIKPFNTLSSGEKAIVLFASLMLTNPDLLLLDEPTNHLDIKTLNWLEKYLNNYSGTIVMVSHDRYFLNKTANKIILLERGNLDIYHGNYDYYLKERENRIMLEFKNYKNQQKQIEAMKKAIKQLEEWGSLAGNEMFFKRARSIQKRIDKIELVAKPLDKKIIPLIFDTNNRSGNDVLKISHLTLEIGNRLLLCGCNMEIKYQERVCLMGNNGTGKSTLIKEIISNNNSLIKIGSNIKIGYMEQNITFDNNNMTVLEYAKKYYIGEEKYLRSILYKFLFIGEQIYKRIGKLSGGEKVRLKLFQLMQENCNFLILDEPTNHIDIETKEVLEEALLIYDGTILFISHDRYFIDKVATKLLVINNQTITTYSGNYSDYDNHMFN
jgi:ATPase subunit of ABC transporter with duplicated ATPase domains